MKTGNPDHKIIGIVGPCASGKTTLINSLQKLGIEARHIAQEHSYVPDMWQKITHPAILIFLDASFLQTVIRRKLDWSIAEYLEQHRRLANARQYADLYILTDSMTPDEVLKTVLDFLETEHIFPIS
jgi:ABC-type glutathione transport system ATPase component